MKKFVKMLAGKASRVASQSVNFAKNHTAALAVATVCLAGSAMAEGKDYSIVSKAADGTVTFTPENMAVPIIDALISGYKAWGLIALILIGAGLVVYILKKK